MFPSELNILKAIKADNRWPEFVDTAHDIPGQYLNLLVKSCVHRGLIRRQWNGSYRLTKTALHRLEAASGAEA